MTSTRTPKEPPPRVQLDYYSDALCVWAYVSQIRLEEVKLNFPDEVLIENHFVTLFGNTEQRIGVGWAERGGFAGFGEHILKVCSDFPHVEVNQRVWLDVHPKSSAPSHLFIKALQILDRKGELEDPRTDLKLIDEVVWQIRCAFFRDAQDIGTLTVLMSIIEALHIPRRPVELLLESGEAFADLCSDMALKENHKLDGSPTYLLNQGRQKLYGNIGYKIIEANISRLLEVREDQASWC